MTLLRIWRRRLRRYSVGRVGWWRPPSSCGLGPWEGGGGVCGGSICVSIVSVYGGVRVAVLSVYCQYLGVFSLKFWRILG